MVDVSVIIPIYNSSKFLKKSLGSLYSQSGIDAEFICIDDGSTDDSYDICEDYRSKDSRFIVMRIDHKGVSAARNAGINVASGKYICFLDSDDRLKRNALKTLFHKAEQCQCDTIKFNATVIRGERWMRDSFRDHDELIEDFQPNDVFIHRDCRPFIWAHFIRRELIADIRFDESLSIGEDQEFIIHYMMGCRRVLFLSKKLYIHYNLKDSSLGKVLKDRPRMCGEHIKIVKRVMTYADLDSPEYAEWIFDTLLDHCRIDENDEHLMEIRSILTSINAVEEMSDERKRSIASQIING